MNIDYNRHEFDSCISYRSLDASRFASNRAIITIPNRRGAYIHAPAELGSARSLLKALPKSRVVFVTMEGGPRLISANMLSIPGG
jgi:riboflavin biosynthesis pyrimidine reductase